MDELIFYGQSGELFVGEGDASAEERIKSLLSDSDRGGLMRRRIVRRPLSGAYTSQSLSFAERERDSASPSMLNADPFSELLSQLAASRKSELPLRLRERDSTGPLSGFAQLANQLATEDSSRRCSGLQLDMPPDATQAQLRKRFTQELVLAAMRTPVADAAPLSSAAATAPAAQP